MAPARARYHSPFTIHHSPPILPHPDRQPVAAVKDPFYRKQKRPKKTRMLDADAWLDSAMYEFWQSLGRGYTRVEDFFSRFQVRGIKRFFTEIVSDGFSFLAIGAVLMTALALPAFDATASGRINKA